MKLTIITKYSLSAFLFLFLTANVVSAQKAEDSSTKIVPPGSNLPAASIAPKRVDLNNLVSLTGQKAPDFVAADMSGTEFKLEKLRGKIVVINLWATWCKPCLAELPELNSLVNKYQAKDVVFLAAAPEDKTVLEVFLQKNPFAYRIFPGALDMIKKYSPKEKPNPETGKSRLIQALPTHIVIDRDGTTVKHSWGFRNDTIDELMQTIERLLEKKQIAYNFPSKRS